MALGTIQFRARRCREEATDQVDGVELRGEIEWFASGSDADIDALATALGPSFVERSSPGGALLRFGNSVGRFLVGALGVLSVRCGKWDDATFDDLLQKLISKVCALPFAAESSAGLPDQRSATINSPVLIHAFFYARLILLSEGSSVLPALQAIVRDPHRLFVKERQRVALVECTRADSRTLDRIATGAHHLDRAQGSASRLALTGALRGHLPADVDVPLVRRSFDTAENRFAKSVLIELGGIVDRVEVLARKRSNRHFWARALADCALMRRALAPFIAHDLWEDVGRMTHLPVGSSILQRRRGYKELLHHHLMLRAAVRFPVDDERTQSLLGLKDVATLYELWTFFAVVDAVTANLGRPPDQAARPEAGLTQVALPWGLRVWWREGVSVYYNLSFSAGKFAKHRSSSVRLRPDIVIHDQRGAHDRMHALDAKLRVDRVNHDDKTGEPAGRTLTFKKADIAKMHAYRDALPKVLTAFVLYPGNRGKHYSALGVESGSYEGVGAIGLIPGVEAHALTQHVARLLNT